MGYSLSHRMAPLENDKRAATVWSTRGFASRCRPRLDDSQDRWVRGKPTV